jgi:GH43 family beta-xylosidase
MNRRRPARKFNNPIGESADPWVVRDVESRRFLWCKMDGDRAIVICVSDKLTCIGGGSPHCVWTAPDSGPASHQVCWGSRTTQTQQRALVYLLYSESQPSFVFSMSWD